MVLGRLGNTLDMKEDSGGNTFIPKRKWFNNLEEMVICV